MSKRGIILRKKIVVGLIISILINQNCKPGYLSNLINFIKKAKDAAEQRSGTTELVDLSIVPEKKKSEKYIFHTSDERIRKNLELDVPENHRIEVSEFAKVIEDLEKRVEEIDRLEDNAGDEKFWEQKTGAYRGAVRDVRTVLHVNKHRDFCKTKKVSENIVAFCLDDDDKKKEFFKELLNVYQKASNGLVDAEVESLEYVNVLYTKFFLINEISEMYVGGIALWDNVDRDFVRQKFNEMRAYEAGKKNIPYL